MSCERQRRQDDTPRNRRVSPACTQPCQIPSRDHHERTEARRRGQLGASQGEKAVGCEPTKPRSGERRGRPKPRSTQEGDRSESTIFQRCRPCRTGLSGDSAIPESRATGAFTSPIARECHRPVDKVRGLPTVQSVNRGQGNTVRRKEGGVAMKPLDKYGLWTMSSGGNQRGEAEGSSFTLLGNKAINEGERDRL